MTTEASDSPFAPAAAEPPSTTERLQETTQVALEVLAQKAAEAGHLVKKVMGILPVKEEDGEEDGYTPSLLTTKMAAKKTTNYEKIEYENKYGNNDKKILVICTEQQYLTCTNDLKFSTGNHPVELFVPLLHLDKAGLEVDFCTPTGKAVQLEQWAMPLEDANVLFMQQKYKNQLEKPLSLKDLASKLTTDSYLGIFIPGGHGAMLGLPEDENVGKVLGWAMDNDKYVISICHGPAAFLANAEKFDGYSCVGFPTAVDKCMVLLGYMPGYLPWFMGDKLAEKNIKLTNIMTTGSTFVDRKLITGDGPTAANALGKLVAETILNDINPIKKPELEDADI